MKRYYEFEAESDYGIGTGYFEFVGRWVSRQLEIYGDKVLWAEITGDSGSWSERVTASKPDGAICDQPFEVLGMKDEEEISQTYFVGKWLLAKKITGCQ